MDVYIFITGKCTRIISGEYNYLGDIAHRANDQGGETANSTVIVPWTCLSSLTYSTNIFRRSAAFCLVPCGAQSYFPDLHLVLLPFSASAVLLVLSTQTQI